MKDEENSQYPKKDTAVSRCDLYSCFIPWVKTQGYKDVTPLELPRERL